MFPTPSSAEDDVEQPFLSHLIELRERLLKIVLGIVIIFFVLFPFANTLYNGLATPILDALGRPMASIDTIGPFFVPLKLVLWLSVFISMPWILYQLWAFIAPGLYRHEKRLVSPLVVSSTILFYCGMAFAYFIVLPLFSKFMASTVPNGVEWMPDIGSFLSFALLLFFAFGLAFEVPIATILLCMAGVTTPDDLASKRPYIFVGAFVIGMILTPPDIISQTLLAIPMWLLFEIGVILSRSMIRRKQQQNSTSS